MKLECECFALDAKGRGLVRIQDKVLSISNLLPGEKAILEINQKKNFIDAKVIEIISASKHRVEPSCSHFSQCGGCQLLHLDYKAQLDFKRRQLVKLFKKEVQIPAILGMEDPTRYRNKVHSTFSLSKKGKVISGIYEENSHHVVNISTCMIQNKEADIIIEALRKCLNDFKIEPFNEDTQTGFIRHVLIRKGFGTSQVLVVLVVANKVFYGVNNFVKAFLKQCPMITSIVMNINDKKTSMVLGNEEKVLYGKGYIEDSCLGMKFKISSSSFYQVNTVQMEKLYAQALKMASVNKNDRVLDAYCGIGTITLCAAKLAKEVIGVELNRQAVHDAIDNAKMNEIHNVRFICSDASKWMIQSAENHEKFDVVIMDPPRSGSDSRFLNACLKLKPRKIIYISCNPETQVRDLEILKRNYKIQSTQGVDMFPFTTEIENICLLVRKTNNETYEGKRFDRLRRNEKRSKIK